jgi:acetyltransferase-like isoleucine patch superfamily enzyme
MRILYIIKRIKQWVWNIYYRSQFQYVGHNVIFGGTHITILGGKMNHGKGISIGDNCTIYDYCQLVTDAYDDNCGIIIGNNCYFNYNCYLCGTGGLIIGDNCIFGPGVKIIPTNHKFEDIHIDIVHQGHTGGTVIIENNVWVGAGAIILPNVKIKSGAIVSAGAVVTRDVEENTIVAGVPATSHKVRGESDNGFLDNK